MLDIKGVSNESIDELMSNSKLPGRRANLELMWQFSKKATKNEIESCLSYKGCDLDNTPEEFVVMCGVLGFCVRNKNNPQFALKGIEEFANSSSWRVREASAMGIQELLTLSAEDVLQILDEWSSRNERYKRCIIAGLCEPKNLKSKDVLENAFYYLGKFTEGFDSIATKLTEDQKILRKALGYAWSVAMVEDLDQGKSLFERFVESENKNIRWIVKNNLKKNRLQKIDITWVETCLEKVEKQ